MADITAEASSPQSDDQSNTIPTPIHDDDILSKKVTLADLSAKGTTLYAQKKYEEAAEVFSQASILQAGINGETAPENAEILFHYGRSLFKVGQSKSDVLGGSAPKTESKPSKSKSSEGGASKLESSGAKQEGGAAAGEGEGKDGGKGAANKPLFQFEGDENFDYSESDENDDEEEQPEEEDDDDLATAFEILDLARVCYVKMLDKLAEEEQPEGKGKELAEDSPTVRHVKERLADTHDALSEISLENELYPNAIEDGRTSLKYKLQLYPEDSEIIAEAHYKLSLALEFASVTTTGGNGATSKREDMDQALRDQAIEQMELAIKTFTLKMQNKEVELATMASPDENDLARKAIGEMKELITDMEQRLVDLKKDPIDTKGLLGGDVNPLGGILGAAAPGESSEEAKSRIEEATKTANDLTGLVRKKKSAPAAASGNDDDKNSPVEAAAAAAEEVEEQATTSNGKRKAEDEAAGDDEERAKRNKTEEP